MRGDLAGGVGDVHRLCGGRVLLAAEDAEAEPEVERCAHDDREVALAEGVRTGLGDQLRMTTGHDAAPHAVGDDRDAGLLHELERDLLGAVGPHVSAQDEHRTLRRCEQLGDPSEVVGIGLDRRRRVAGRRGAELAAVEELVQRDVDERGSAMRRPGQRECLVHGRGDVRDRVGRGRGLGDRLEDRRMIELLQRAAAPATSGRAAADDHERRAGEARLRDGADAVGDPWPGGEHREAG
jgi:hypothetical protein